MDNFRKTQARIEIKRNQMMLHEIIEGLNDIVLEQIHHRLCQHPPPEIKQFLTKITEKSNKKFFLAEGLPLPQSHEALDHQPVDLEPGKFLFPDMKETDAANAADLKKQSSMIKKLLEKYDQMSAKCKVQVEPVHNYLLDHYNMINKMLSTPKEGEAAVPAENKGTESAGNVNDMNPNNLNPANLDTPDNTKTNEVGGSSVLNANGLIANNLNQNPLLTRNVFGSNYNALSPKALRNSGDSSGVGIKSNLDDFGIKPNIFSKSQIEKYIEDALRSQGEDREAQDLNDELVKRETKNKVTKWDVSNEYKKLMETAAKIRLKRKTEEKLGKLFGEKLKKPNVEADIKDYSQIKFESPVVYSLDH